MKRVEVHFIVKSLVLIVKSPMVEPRILYYVILFYVIIIKLVRAPPPPPPPPPRPHHHKNRIIKIVSRRWQAPGAVKKRRKKVQSRKIRRTLSVPIYVFDDSEQKVEFEVRIKPCSHLSNCLHFLL